MKKGLMITGVSLIVLAVVGLIGYLFWPAIQGVINGNKFYTANDVQRAYDDGYSKGAQSEKSLLSQVEQYKRTIDECQARITVLTHDLEVAQAKNAADTKEIERLTAELTRVNLEIENSQTRINGLIESIESFETYIQTLGLSNMFVVKFVYNDQPYYSTIVNAGETVNIPNPTNTDHIHFNGWKVNGVIVDPTTYPINANTTFTADITFKHKVTFLKGTEVYATVYVVDNGFATVTAPESTEREHFKGWLLNNEPVDLSTLRITGDITFHASIDYFWLVTYVVDDEVVRTVYAPTGNYTLLPTGEYNGVQVYAWGLEDGTTVSQNYNLTCDVTFYRANIGVELPGTTVGSTDDIHLLPHTALRGSN